MAILARRWAETVSVRNDIRYFFPEDSQLISLVDNGYIQFTYVRVPRAHLLMKHTQVSRDGQVTEPVSILF